MAPDAVAADVRLQDGLSAIRYQDVSDDAAKTLWAQVRDAVRDGPFELCENYHNDGAEMPIATADEIWSTMVDPTVLVRAPDTLELSTTFDWQDPDDEHVITVYVEAGELQGVSIDG